MNSLPLPPTDGQSGSTVLFVWKYSIRPNWCTCQVADCVPVNHATVAYTVLHLVT